jgi:outer membrane protein assembly factor BamB
MNSYPALRRWLSAFAAVLVVGVATVIAVSSGRGPDADQAAGEKEAKGHAWPLFGGSVSRNMVNTVEKDIPVKWDIEKAKDGGVLWSADLGSKAYGGPVVADGKVFVGTNNENPKDPKIEGDKGILMCFRQSDGKFLWQQVHDKLPAGRVNDWPEEGICSTPVVEGKRLYYVSNRCEVICSDTDGQIQWKYDMIGKLNVFPHNLATCSPLIVGDLLFIITSNGVDEGHVNIPSPRAPSFIALKKATGELAWQNSAPGNRILHGQWSNPVYAEAGGKPQVIFPGGDGWLRAFTPEKGDLIWAFDCNPKNSVYKLGPSGTRSDFLATPVVWENKLYVGVGQDPEHEVGVGHFWCIDLEKATRQGATNKDHDVSPVEDNFDPKADVNKNSALAWHYGGKAPAEEAEKIGRNYYFGRTMSTAAVHDGLVYAVDLGGYVHCLDALTGKEYWEHATGAHTWSSPYWVDGKVYLGNDDKVMNVFAHGKEKKILAENEMDGTIRATPTAVDGVLFVATENKLYAIKSRGQ